MPTVFREKGIRFHFFVNEGNPPEPMHIHADRSDAAAKIWLEPDISVAKNVGYSGHELTMLVRLVRLRRGEIERVWREFFS